MHQLIKDTHRNVLPYTSVWDGLISVDSTVDSANVHLIYSDKDIPATPYDNGTCTYWNREHLWPRSRGVSDTGPDNTDLHHIRPVDCNVDSARGNLYFGQCGTVSVMSSCVSPAHIEAATDTEKDITVFLPPASQRGDMARSIFYMDLRYDGDEPYTENLIVTDCPESVANGAGMGEFTCCCCYYYYFCLTYLILYYVRRRRRCCC